MKYDKEEMVLINAYKKGKMKLSTPTRKEIEAINKSLPAHARVRRFINLHKELDADESELTRTQKRPCR